jgi:hypothetical protein
MDQPPPRQAVIHRLRYLWTFELFDSFFLPAVVALSLRWTGRPLGPIFWGGALLCSWLLWQGAAYWYLKLRAVRAREPFPTKLLPVYAALRRVSWALLALAPLAWLATALLGAPPRLGLDGVVGFLLYLLAVLEQINYYHWQLMYDNRADLAYLRGHRRLKRGAIARELASRGG